MNVAPTFRSAHAELKFSATSRMPGQARPHRQIGTLPKCLILAYGSRERCLPHDGQAAPRVAQTIVAYHGSINSRVADPSGRPKPSLECRRDSAESRQCGADIQNNVCDPIGGIDAAFGPMPHDVCATRDDGI